MWLIKSCFVFKHFDFPSNFKMILKMDTIELFQSKGEVDLDAGQAALIGGST